MYKAFRLEDLTAKEWEALSTEVIPYALPRNHIFTYAVFQTTQAIVRDTIAGRKNTSPQNIYETSQLYAAGALKVACIGLQCVGFNKAMYRAILEQATKCALAGKWKGTATPPNAGLGAVGGAWNATASDVVDGSGIAGMSISGNENAPAQNSNGKGKK